MNTAQKALQQARLNLDEAEAAAQVAWRAAKKEELRKARDRGRELTKEIEVKRTELEKVEAELQTLAQRFERISFEIRTANETKLSEFPTEEEISQRDALLARLAAKRDQWQAAPERLEGIRQRFTLQGQLSELNGQLAHVRRSIANLSTVANGGRVGA